jgi:hypothetical protein
MLTSQIDTSSLYQVSSVVPAHTVAYYITY